MKNVGRRKKKTCRERRNKKGRGRQIAAKTQEGKTIKVSVKIGLKKQKNRTGRNMQLNKKGREM